MLNLKLLLELMKCIQLKDYICKVNSSIERKCIMELSVDNVKLYFFTFKNSSVGLDIWYWPGPLGYFPGHQKVWAKSLESSPENALSLSLVEVSECLPCALSC